MPFLDQGRAGLFGFAGTGIGSPRLRRAVAAAPGLGPRRRSAWCMRPQRRCHVARALV